MSPPPGAPDPARDLMARVDAEVRDRIAEAVDFVCLDVMARLRQDHGLPAMAPDSVADRAEFEAGVETFLTRLEHELRENLDPQERPPLTAAAGSEGDRVTRLLAAQVALAKRLPDYWQRFERVRAAYAADVASAGPVSGRDRPGWLGRLLGS